MQINKVSEHVTTLIQSDREKEILKFLSLVLEF